MIIRRSRIPRAMFSIGATLSLIGAPLAPALPYYGENCAVCHSANQPGMSLANFQGTANLGAGTLKVFTVGPGRVLPIQISVTNSYGLNYGLAVDNLGSAGTTNSTHHLVFAADPA